MNNLNIILFIIYIFDNFTKNNYMKNNSLMSGALVLSIGGVLAKIFSAVYRIFLTRVLGGEGIGLYQLIFPFYSLCVILATAGLPMAISKVVAKNKGGEKAVLKKCFLFTSVVALIVALILFLSSKGLASLQGKKEISICYMILAPTIILISVSSVLRGYFQGKHNFVPSAVSNIVEQFIKLCVGLILCLSLLSVSLIASIIGAVVGIVISEIVSLAILILYIKKEKIKSNRFAKVNLKDVVKDVLPIALTNLVLPISTFVDSVLVVNLLAVNFSNNFSVFLYGLESGAVSSLVSLPTIFSFAIASVILPNIANTNCQLNRNHKLSMAIKIILIITIPCVISFTLFPNRLIEFLYNNKLNAFGVNGTNIASRLLTWSGFGVVFLAISQVYSSCLQAVDERFVTIRNLTISVILKFVIEVVFLPSKLLNIYTLAIANTVCYVTVMILNHFEIKQYFKLRINYMFSTKLVFSNLIMVVCLIILLSLRKSIWNTLLAFIVAIIVYLILLIKLKILNRQDMAVFKYKV